MKLKIRNIIIPVVVFILLIVAVFYLSSTVALTVTFKASTSQETILNSISAINGNLSGTTIDLGDKTVTYIELSRWNELLYLNKLKNNEAVDTIEKTIFLEEF